MTRAEALAEIHHLIAQAKENQWTWITIEPELQAVANGVHVSWNTAMNFSVPVIEQWAEEIERSIAAETIKRLTV